MNLNDFEKRLKKYLHALIVLSALFLWSCSPVKRATTTDVQSASQAESQTILRREAETEITATVAVRDSLHVRMDSATDVWTAGTEEISIRIREYDTDKPVDPATGTPPLKRETTETRRRTDTGRQTQTTAQTTDQDREIVEDVAKRLIDNTRLEEYYKHSNNTVAQVETSEKRGLNAIQKTLLTIGGLVALVGVIWLAVRLTKRIYKPF